MISSLLRGRLTAGQLRDRWGTLSTGSEWTFPSDWYTPAIDALCEALCETGTDPTVPATRLGRERARVGVGLREALRDVDVLAGLVSQRAGALARAVSLGWGEAGGARSDAVIDGLTGLASVEYLRIRCREVYRAAEVEGSSASATHALVIVRLGGEGAHRFLGQMPMVLVADSLRTVFADGQSLCRIGVNVAAALTPRHDALGRQVRLLSDMVVARVSTDRDAAVIPQVWIERLPAAERTVPDLLADIAR